MKQGEPVCIADHALIGNCRSAALVAKDGSINWCCFPEFHSPAIFAALLDGEKGGFFFIRPAATFDASQRYLADTNVVETCFTTNEGSVKLLDCFTVMEEADKKHALFSDHEILRVVEGVTGTVKMEFVYAPKINYGERDTLLKDRKALGVHFHYKENTYVLQSTLDKGIIRLEKGRCSGEFHIHEGGKLIFSLSCSSQEPAIIPELRSTGLRRLQQTIQYWTDWSLRCRYNGVYKDEVMRSALALKLLSHAPSGAIVAAPTTSLPEEIKGVRNWDYRFCWLRDASFTVRVLIKLGYYDEAHAYMSWILHATQLSRPRLQVVYTVFGDTRIEEKACDWLSGYKESQPVRIGNNAYNQFQLDVYGEVLDAIYSYSQLVKEFDNDTKRFMIGIGRSICKLWDQPDEGIWEIRSSKQHHTHSKVLAWVGLDRLLKLCEKYKWQDAPIHQFRDIRRRIQNEIEEKGVDPQEGHYKIAYTADDPEAALLVLPLVNYCEASAPRMIKTRQFIRQKLEKNHLLYRHLNTDDGLPGKEGAFLVCNFWLIENLARSGDLQEAISLFEKTIGHANSCGLLSEETDPDTGELLGNYPQGFSHIGLINAALSINEAIKQNKHGSR